jgi:hypothetical protein
MVKPLVATVSAVPLQKLEGQLLLLYRLIYFVDGIKDIMMAIINSVFRCEVLL